MPKNQITLETTVILGIIIALTLIAIFIMFKLIPHNSNSFSTSVMLYQAIANASNLKIYLSKAISLPTSIVLYYEPLNFSKIYSFSFTNCEYTEQLLPSSTIYTFYYNATNCNLHVFNGTYIISNATYYEDGMRQMFKINDANIGYQFYPTVVSSTLTLSPPNAMIGETVNAIITTNIKNATYSLFLGTYVIPTCENISITKSTQCSFVVSPSIGVVSTNTFYIVNAYIYNSTVNERTNATLYVIS